MGSLLVNDFLLDNHRLRIDDGDAEEGLVGGLVAATGFLLVVVEIEQLVVALAIGYDAAGSQHVVVLGNGNGQLAFGNDCHVLGIQLGPNDLFVLAVC